MLKRCAILFLCVCLPPAAAFSQAKVASSLIKSDSSHATVDSLGLTAGTIVIPIRPAKSGSLAMLMSAVLPGSGQVYAHHYWTIPVIWGLGYYYVSIASDYNSQYKNYQAQFDKSVKADTVNHLGNTDLAGTRDKLHNARDEFLIYLFLVYAANILDAYVSATLYNFDVSDNLAAPAAMIRFRIPLR